MGEGADEAAGTVQDEQLGPEAAAQTLDQFVAGVLDAARKREDFDATLLAILTNHIVREDPAGDSVAIAAAKIEALAEARASAPEKEPRDGEDNP